MHNKAESKRRRLQINVIRSGKVISLQYDDMDGLRIWLQNNAKGTDFVSVWDKVNRTDVFRGPARDIMEA